jgi:hypothetical protein
MARSLQTVALIPYFGGDSDAAPSNKANRLDYLKRTVQSLASVQRIIVGVNNFLDVKDIKTARLPVEIEILDCEPRYIPVTLFRVYQVKLPESVTYVYVTEADQVLHMHIQDNPVFGDTFLVPHRLEELGVKDQGKDRGMVVTFNSREWVLPNGSPQAGDYYQPDVLTDQYGGAFLCRREFFTKIPFSENPNMPIEHATGLDAAKAGIVLKTSEWSQCFVEHLSGKEYHDTL